MREYPVDTKFRKVWKKYPLRLSGLSLSRCHRLPTILVQSMEGGFVTRNCPQCGKSTLLPKADFLKLGLWVACPECRQRMVAGLLPSKNYGYTCAACNLGVKLADLLPSWTDL
jgi:uncharacterized protein (DUF983 family)